MPDVDTIHPYPGFWSTGTVCRIKVYRPAGFSPMVITTERPENESTGITNVPEEMAADVLATHVLDRVGEERPFVWIEHYRPRRGLRRGRWRMAIGRPVWRRLTRDQVEALAGEPRI